MTPKTKTKVDISHKSRRLVERAVSLAVRRANTTVYAACLPSDSERTSDRKWKEAQRKDRNLTRSAYVAKQVLLEHIAELERLLEANRTERRRLVSQL